MWTVIHYHSTQPVSRQRRLSNPHMTFALIALISRLSARYYENPENPYLTRSNYQPYSRLSIPAARWTPHMTSEIRPTIPAARLTPHMTSEIRPTIRNARLTWDWANFLGTRFLRKGISLRTGARF